MGMCYVFHRVSDAKVKKLEEEPFLIHLYTGWDEEDMEYLIQDYCESVKEANQPMLTFWQRIFPWMRPEVEKIEVRIPEITWDENENAHGDIHKTWNLIHAGLTGKSTDGEWPLSFIMDYNHADYFSEEKEICFGYSSKSVVEIADAIREIDSDRLFSTIDSITISELEEVYQAESLKSSSNKSKKYVAEWFKELKQFVLETATLRYGINFKVC